MNTTILNYFLDQSKFQRAFIRQALIIAVRLYRTVRWSAAILPAPAKLMHSFQAGALWIYNSGKGSLNT